MKPLAAIQRGALAVTVGAQDREDLEEPYEAARPRQLGWAGVKLMGKINGEN